MLWAKALSNSWLDEGPSLEESNSVLLFEVVKELISLWTLMTFQVKALHQRVSYSTLVDIYFFLSASDANDDYGDENDSD